MGILKKIEGKFVGRIIKDYGVIDEKNYGIGKFKYSILLTEKDNERRTVIKRTVAAVLAASVEYFIINMDNVQKFRDILDDALKTQLTSPIEPR